MDDARCSKPGAARRTFMIPGLLLLLPLVIGARDCERAPVDAECDGGDCGPSGEAGQGACLWPVQPQGRT